jgi:hypothetical protein
MAALHAAIGDKFAKMYAKQQPQQSTCCCEMTDKATRETV